VFGFVSFFYLYYTIGKLSNIAFGDDLSTNTDFLKGGI